MVTRSGHRMMRQVRFKLENKFVKVLLLEVMTEQGTGNMCFWYLKTITI